MSTQGTTLPALSEQRPFDLDGMRKVATLITPFAGQAILQCCDEIARLTERASLAAQEQEAAPLQAKKARGVPTETQILTACEEAGLWPNTAATWVANGAFARYHAAINRMLSEARQAEPAQAQRLPADYNRCEFEVHASERGWDMERFPEPGSIYRSFETDKHWQTWRAALAALQAERSPCLSQIAKSEKQAGLAFTSEQQSEREQLARAGTLTVTVSGSCSTVDVDWLHPMPHMLPVGEYPMFIGTKGGK